MAAEPASAATPTGAPHSSAPASAGGYRLVRVLGEGRSAVVYLGYADSGTDDAARRTAAVKVFRAGIAADRIDAEVAALCAVDHPHLARLVDLASTDAGLPCLVLERCDGGGLAQLVADRSGLSSGEAVTILAPLAAAVAALHAAGYVHRDIRLSNVLFAASGAPVLCGFGTAAVLPTAATPAALAADASVIDDRRQLLLVVRSVLERLDEPLGLPLDDWLDPHPVDADDFAPRLADSLFDLGEPQPVRLRDLAGQAAPSIVRTAIAAPAGEEPERSRAWGAVLPALRLLAGHARGVRRRYWTIAGGVAVSLVVAAFAVPHGPSSAPEAGGNGGSAGERGALVLGDDTRASGEMPAGQSVSGEQRPGDEGAIGQAESTAAPDGPEAPDRAVLGDDPVAALVELLVGRARCVRDLSVLCLDAVLQRGSAALERDTAVIRALQSGGEQTPDAAVETSGPLLVERLGDSALLDLGDVPQTQPASALVMRGEAGWRIRDYLDD